MMTQSLPKPALIITAVVLLFGALMIVRNVMDTASREAADPQIAYDELAVALEDAGLLPLGGEDELLLAYAGLMNLGKIAVPPSGTGGQNELWLGGVLQGSVRNGRITALYLNPQQWRELRSGLLREASRKLAAMPLVRHSGVQRRKSQGGVMPSSRKNFSFTCTVNGISFVFTPRFDGDRCVSIYIRKN